MKSKITTLFILLAITVFSQNENSSDNKDVKMDTIKTFNKVILCKIVEIADENVKFKYPNEDILVSLNKNMIEKINFSSGRTQIFSESSNFKTVIGWEDWEKVSSTMIDDEVDGLFKLGDVSSKAKGGTVFSNMNKIKDKASQKLKIKAAMIGANIIYLASDHTEGNRYNALGSNTTETMLTAFGYSNKIPDIISFKNLILKKPIYKLVQIVSMPFNKKRPFIVKANRHATIDLSNYKIRGNFIFVVYEDLECRISYLSSEKIILLREGKKRTYNYILE